MLAIALGAFTWLVWVQYTTFELGWQQTGTSSNNMSTAAAPLSVSLSTAEGSTTRFDVNVANIGERHGRVSVLAMWRPIGHHAHLKQKLFGSSNSSAMYCRMTRSAGVAFVLLKQSAHAQVSMASS